MAHRLYTDLASWWPLLSPPAEYAEEAEICRHALGASGAGRVEQVLEFGSGGGNTASHLKRHVRMTLLDAAPAMLEVSRALNPECEHVLGDMRSVRLDRTFDAVYVGDAASYLTTEDDLAATMETAFRHCRPGGVFLLAPDDTLETWGPSTHTGGVDGDGRGFRYLQWTHDPDPNDAQITTTFAYLLREGAGPIRVERDEHVLGLFPRDTWLRRLAEAGFVPGTLPFPHRDSRCDFFLGRRPL